MVQHLVRYAGPLQFSCGEPCLRKDMIHMELVTQIDEREQQGQQGERKPVLIAHVRQLLKFLVLKGERLAQPSHRFDNLAARIAVVAMLADGPFSGP